jgi:Uncharacterized protein conserved in bacteria (DUF2188)
MNSCPPVFERLRASGPVLARVELVGPPGEVKLLRLEQLVAELVQAPPGGNSERQHAITECVAALVVASEGVAMMSVLPSDRGLGEKRDDRIPAAIIPVGPPMAMVIELRHELHSRDASGRSGVTPSARLRGAHIHPISGPPCAFAYTTGAFPAPHELWSAQVGKPGTRLLLRTARHFDWISWSPDARQILVERRTPRSLGRSGRRVGSHAFLAPSRWTPPLAPSPAAVHWRIADDERRRLEAHRADRRGAVSVAATRTWRIDQKDGFLTFSARGKPLPTRRARSPMTRACSRKRRKDGWRLDRIHYTKSPSHVDGGSSALRRSFLPCVGLDRGMQSRLGNIRRLSYTQNSLSNGVEGESMARGWIHTVHRDGAWLNEEEGGGALSRHSTKAEAVEDGRQLARARRTEHVIHNVDGTIAERNSYGGDPYPPRG